MALSKDVLRARFSGEPDKYYRVALFDELGFKRRRCSCGKWFWTLNPEQEKCPDPPCTQYGFIGQKIGKLRKDYIGTWRAIERFFVKNGHTAVPSYPTVCRWFPGLYFTIASIVAFQRSVGGEPVFEFPSNPLIIPQVCLRFSDIPNVGVSGRHHTSFIMIGQHSLYDGSPKGYWKDR
ncbi:MAG: alanine--tRNA ligase-related protein [Candidatus Micrarchaeota archaeon]